MNVMMHIMLVINSNKPSNKRSVGSEFACHGQYHHNTCTGEGELQVCAVYTTRAPIRQTIHPADEMLVAALLLGQWLGILLPNALPAFVDAWRHDVW